MTPFYSNVHAHTLAGAYVHVNSLIHPHVYSYFCPYFHWWRVSQKSTFNGKRLVFLRKRIHTETRDRTRERTHTGNVRFGTCVKGQCFAMKLRIAQVRILTISGHVISVSAQRRDNEYYRASVICEGEMDPRQVSFGNVFVVSSSSPLSAIY